MLLLLPLPQTLTPACSLLLLQAMQLCVQCVQLCMQQWLTQMMVMLSVLPEVCRLGRRRTAGWSLGVETCTMPHLMLLGGGACCCPGPQACLAHSQLVKRLHPQRRAWRPGSGQVHKD